MVLIGGNNEVDVYEGKTNFIYYRGIKIYNAQRSYEYTYNLKKQIEITEDRTAKYSFQIDWILHKFLVQSDDLKYLNVIFEKESQELHGLNVEEVKKYQVSDEFIVAAKKHHKEEKYLGKKTRGYIVSDEEGLTVSWQKQLIIFLEDNDDNEVMELVNEHKKEIITMLENSIKE
jgi:hypothetical protein